MTSAYVYYVTKLSMGKKNPFKKKHRAVDFNVVVYEKLTDNGFRFHIAGKLLKITTCQVLV